MKSICIKSNCQNYINYLLNELSHSNIKNISFVQKNFKSYNNVIIHYSGNDLDLFYSQISNLLCLLILDEIEDELLKEYLNTNYFYFNLNDVTKILNLCIDALLEDFPASFSKRYNILYNSIYTFISTNKSIVLSGFISFRLKDYLKTLYDIVDECVNLFVIESEYLEFISLLNLYVLSQNTNSNTVNLIYTSPPLLLDENKKQIETNGIRSNAKYLSDITFSDNDLILNSLLNLLPSHINIYISSNEVDDFISTLQLIFENKISLYKNYDFCIFEKYIK